VDPNQGKIVLALEKKLGVAAAKEVTGGRSEKSSFCCARDDELGADATHGWALLLLFSLWGAQW
jgi:hypothetical protein